MFYLTEEQQIENTVKPCNCYGAEPENRSNKVYPHTNAVECSNSGIWKLSGKNGRDKLRTGGKGDNKKPCLVAFGCKLNEKVGNGQGERYHCHEIDRRIADLVPFQRGQKAKVNHVGQNSHRKKRLLICFGKLDVLEKMRSIEKCCREIEQ